jgi:hypothetical protein
MLMFVGTCAITFGIGATLTGLAITLTEDTDTAEREFGDDVKAPSPERYFWVRNAPYSLNDPDNLLKLQQMRPPSERTINPRLALESLTLSARREGEREVERNHAFCQD